MNALSTGLQPLFGITGSPAKRPAMEHRTLESTMRGCTGNAPVLSASQKPRAFPVPGGRGGPRRSRPGKVVSLFGPWAKTASIRTTTQVQAVPVPSPNTWPSDMPPSTLMIIMLAQGVALVGAIVASLLAGRKKQVDLERINKQLREINDHLMHRQAPEDPGLGSLLPEGFADMDGGLPAGAREALEHALEAPSVQHPADPLGDELLSPRDRRGVTTSREVGTLQREVVPSGLAGSARSYNFQLLVCQTRKAILQLLENGKEALTAGEEELALTAAVKAESLAKLLEDKRAERAGLRMRAKALRKMGNLRASMEALQSSLHLSGQLEDTSGDADTLGALGDVCAMMGDLERAGRYYDQCLAAIHAEDEDNLLGI